MKVLVTGASGFLGRSTVRAFRERGHAVRAMVRPATDVARLAWPGDIELYHADLRLASGLTEAFWGVDAVIHLAAATSGGLEAQLAGSVRATENLLAAMTEADARRMVLCSSFSVYDWKAPRFTLDEDSPLETHLYRRDDYAIAKTWQERIVRQWANEHAGQLTVMRPGFIWGRDLPLVSGSCLAWGKWLIVNGPWRRLPLVHVDNCADAFVTAAERDETLGRTYNVIDTDQVTAWQHVGDYVRRSDQRCRRLAVPYWVGMATARLAKLTSLALFGRRGQLPGFLTPIKHRARFRSLGFPHQRLTDELGWQPPLSYEQCLERTYSRAEHHTDVSAAAGDAAWACPKQTE
jgi:nucleoside-diphosphate-sugar epimerase